MYRKSTFLTLAFLMMVGIILTYTKLTDGFSLKEVTSSLEFDPSRETFPPSEMLKQELNEAFLQPFKYVGKGCQFYAFESQDHKYILKFFKHKHLRPLQWIRTLPIPRFLLGYAEKKINKREERIAKLFSSCKLAYEELSIETGVVFLHLNRTPVISPRVTLYNKLGLKHQIDLNDYEFVLQQRGIPAKTMLKNLASENDATKIQAKIHQLLDVVVLRCEKGIRDEDRAFVQNIAFLPDEERAIFVDIGQFVKDASIQSKEQLEADLHCRKEALRLWVKAHTPFLTKYLEEAFSLQKN